MSKQVTQHITGEGEILFMAAARALMNKNTGKEEFSIKVKLPSSDATIAHLKDVNPAKIDTKANRALEGQGEVIVNFNSNFAPTVLGADGSELKDKAIPFFDGRKDSGKAIVSYKVIDFGDNKIVRLSGIKLTSLNLAPRGDSEGQTMDETRNLLNQIHQL